MDYSSDTDALDGNIVSKPKTTGFVYVVTVVSALGGFLFGYDTGVVSGAMIIIRGVFSLSDLWQELIVSITIAGAWAFSLPAGALSDRLGRKAVIIAASFVFTGGAILMGVSNAKEPLLVGRLIVGAGIGLASMVNPVYIAEVSPAHIRGRLVTINNCCITAGQFTASVVAGAFSGDEKNGWRYMLGLAGVPAAIQFFVFLFMPESPRWLIQKNRYEEGIAVLRRVRGSQKEIEEEFESIRSSCLEDEREQNSKGSSLVIKRILQTPTIRRALIVGCLLQIFQQISGINTVMYYSASIIEMSGVHDHSKAIWLSAATAGVNCVCALIGLLFVERIGRRLLILGSLAGVIVSLLVLAVGFHLSHINSPEVNNIYSGSSACDAYTSCVACVNDPKCGFCFEDFGSSHNPRYNSSCLPTADGNTDFSAWGTCAMANSTHSLVDSSYAWAYDWCPSSMSWIILLGLGLYLFFFAPGMGPMPWTINSEIYPLWARGTCYSISTSFNWLFNLFVSMTFLTLTKVITQYGTFYMYTGLAFLGWIVFYCLIPETRGRTLEEVESLFSKPWLKSSASDTDKTHLHYGSISSEPTSKSDDQKELLPSA